MPNPDINRRLLFSPNKSQSFSFGTVIQYLDGTIVGTEFIDKSGNNLNADVINNDITITGFPYKSATMIAQKAANFGVIPDPTNFWFTSGGVPNQIPVISLYNNVDYANQIFCKHLPQIINNAGIEVFEPRVSEVVTYISALTGQNLVSANSYFGVTSAVAGAKYVPGDYANNTLAIAAVSAGATIYNKSGVKTETTQLLPNKALFIRGIGYSVNTYGGAPSSLVSISGGVNVIERLIISGNNSINIGFRVNVSGCTVTKTKLYQIANGNTFFKECGTGLTVSDCIFIGTTQTNLFSTTAPNLIVTGCYISGNYGSGMFGVGALTTETQTVQYCKISTSIGVQINATPLVFNFYYNTVSIATLGDVFRMLTANCFLNVKYNNIIGTGTTSASGALFFANFPATGTFNVEYNTYTTNDGAGHFFIATSSKDSVVRGNMVVLASADFSYTLISSSALIENNLVISNGSGGAGNIGAINISSATGLKNISLTIQKNKVVNPRYFNSSLGGLHNCIYVRDYINSIVQYNWTAGAGTFNIIIKSTTAMDNNECPCIYNISYLNGLLAKGMGYVKFYNNTVIDSTAGGIILTVADDATDLKTCYIKNNIVVNAIDNGYLIDVVSELIAFPHEINYNIYYSTSSTPFRYKGVAKTFAQWQALGYDANSIMLTADQFNNLFIDYSGKDFRTKTKYMAGIDLGSSYNTGLDTSSDFHSNGEIPTIATKTQSSSYWQCGAFII